MVWFRKRGRTGRRACAGALVLAALCLCGGSARADAPIFFVDQANLARPGQSQIRYAALGPAKATPPSLKGLLPSYGYGGGAQVASGPILDLRGALAPEPALRAAPSPSPPSEAKPAETDPVASALAVFQPAAGNADQPRGEETGLASWYGEEFQGRRTASGEPFDAAGMTAAHPTLPLQSRVRVTNLANGREVTLRVNDRGPFHGDRVIDVSRRAAELLGFREAGQARVRVTYLGPAPATAAQATEAGPTPVAVEPPAFSQAPAATGYFVQIGAFAERANAERARNQAAAAGAAGITAIQAQGREFFRVRLGPWSDMGAAEAARAAVSGLGFSGARISQD